MTLEPPKGLKSNLVRQYNRLTDAYLASSTKPDDWRRLVFGLCLFHAVIQVWCAGAEPCSLFGRSLAATSSGQCVTVLANNRKGAALVTPR